MTNATSGKGKVSPVNFLARLFKPSNWQWLSVGLGLGRWLVLLFLGVALMALGLAHLLVSAYSEPPLAGVWGYLALQFIDRSMLGLLFSIVGLGMVLLAIVKLSESLVSEFSTDDESWVQTLYRKRARRQGPKIVALGGGTGLSTLLRGLKEHTDQLTAIVTVADDGGSSGRLRRDLGVLPPGDFRQCIAALADAEPLMSQLLQYRFGSGTGLEGHSFGNLFIVAMAGITGNFERALAESSRVLAVRGQVLPSTLQTVTLCAETRAPELSDEHVQRIAGESAITHRGTLARLARVYLEPEHVAAYPGAVRAILDADLIIAGPGSLYTSVLPNLLVEDIQHALHASSAAKVYICNVATQPGETDHFAVEEHFDALAQHVGADVFTHVIANNNWQVNFPSTSQSKMVHPHGDSAHAAAVILADIVDEETPWRHDPAKLARVILEWYNPRST